MNQPGRFRLPAIVAIGIGVNLLVGTMIYTMARSTFLGSPAEELSLQALPHFYNTRHNQLIVTGVLAGIGAGLFASGFLVLTNIPVRAEIVRPKPIPDPKELAEV